MVKKIKILNKKEKPTGNTGGTVIATKMNKVRTTIDSQGNIIKRTQV